ncbi:ATP-binding protein [Streptomyces sp. NPDC091272]|uniref:ATP-binding protein n=1 Tax=Streptomyces sp. NPDC091272 TaxID=3365981 RepID=UPI003800E571
MKQSAGKSLGAAALGAVFVAAAAGSATAAPVALPDAANVLGTVTGTVTGALPLGQVGEMLPPGGPEALKAGTDALGMSAATAPTALSPAGEGQDPVSGLLGGLPTGAVPGLGG